MSIDTGIAGFSTACHSSGAAGARAWLGKVE
jgi:hypothetical protein